MFRSGFYTLLEKGAALVFALGTAMLLLRGLSKADFAAWGLFLVVTYFFDMGRSGLIQNGLMTFWASRPAERGVLSTTALVLSLAFSLVSNVLLWLGTAWLCRTYNTPQLVSVLPIYFVTNGVLALLYHCNFVQQANAEFRGIFWATFCWRGLLFGWVLGCRLLDHPLLLDQLAWVLCAGAVAGLLPAWWYARPYLLPLQRIDFKWIREFFAYGKYVLGTNLSTMFYKNIDKLTLGHLVGPAAFAVYDAAGKITQMVEAPSFSIAAAVFPQSARQMVERGPEGVRDLYERSVAATLAIILPFVIFALVAAEPLVRVFAGPAYADSADVLRLTAFFGLFLPFAVQFGTVLDSTGRPHVNFRYTLFTAVLNLGLSYLLVWKLGLFGAAYATLLSYAVSFVLMQHRLSHDFGVRWWRSFALIPEMYRVVWKRLAD